MFAVELGRRRGWVIVGCALAVVLGVVVYQARSGTWATLHRAADRLDPPAAFEEVHRRDEGTALCVVSCDVARVRILYRIMVPADEACAAFAAAIAAVASDVENDPIPGDICGGSGTAKGADVLVGWGIRRVEVTAEDPYEVEWVRSEASRLEGLVAVVVFSRGIAFDPTAP